MEIIREIKRFKGQIGTKPKYPDQAEEEFKLIREGELILQIRHDLIASIGKWTESTKDLSNGTISDLRAQIKELLEKLR